MAEVYVIINISMASRLAMMTFPEPLPGRSRIGFRASETARPLM